MLVRKSMLFGLRKAELIFMLIALSLVVVICSFADASAAYYRIRYPILLSIIVTCITLLINSRLRNPFVDLLHIVFLGFFVFRAIVGLFFDFHLDPITKSANTSHLFEAFYFLIFCFVTLVAASYIFLTRLSLGAIICTNSDKSILRFLVILSALLLTVASLDSITDFLSCQARAKSPGNSVSTILRAIFFDERLLVFLVTLPLIIRNAWRKIDLWIIGLSLTLFLVSSVVGGGKAGPLFIILHIIFGVLVGLRHGVVFDLRKNWRLFFGGLLLLAVLVPICFVMGKAMRVVNFNGYGCADVYSGSPLTRLKLVNEWRLIASGKDAALISPDSSEVKTYETLGGEALSHLSERTGFLDFFLEKFLNSDYRRHVTASTYYRAVVDKLTPGFEIYNEPFVSRSLYTIHHKAKSEHTNSEQMTLFGEAWILFGWASPVYLIAFCVLLGSLIRLGNKLCINFPIGRVILSIFLIRLFYFWLEGMGLDMMLILHFIHTGILIVCLYGISFLACYYWDRFFVNSPHSG